MAAPFVDIAPPKKKWLLESVSRIGFAARAQSTRVRAAVSGHSEAQQRTVTYSAHHFSVEAAATRRTAAKSNAQLPATAAAAAATDSNGQQPTETMNNAALANHSDERQPRANINNATATAAAAAARHAPAKRESELA